VTRALGTFETIEEPLWFGPDERPLLGWLTMPAGGYARGTILCALPIGREARAGRRAFRSLALSLAASGYVTLRFDYDGTGDSSGLFDDEGRDKQWVSSVVEGAKYLRTFGLDSMSAVGMRLGATLLGVAADQNELNLSSVVLWDPCESGKSFLREINALEALRRDDVRIVAGGPIETSEFVISPRAAQEIGRIALTTTNTLAYAERTLVVSRAGRPLSTRLRTHLESVGAEFETTEEQEALLDVDPMWATLPERTTEDIVDWLSTPELELTPFDVATPPKSAVVLREVDRFVVEERIIEFGPERLFGIVTQPIGETHGPLIVMFNAAIEEHTGPSRLWVDLSRRWAGYGMRSVRFDLRGLGDSPWLGRQFDSEFFFVEWLDDVLAISQELIPDDPSDAVFIGLCSGAYWAIEAALALGARGACIINPPMYIDALHTARRLETSRRPSVRSTGQRLKNLIRRRWFFAKHPWMSAATWHLLRTVLPSAYSEDILAKLADDGTDLLLLYGNEEIWPYDRVPYFRSLDYRRLTPSAKRRIEFISGLDHGMHVAEGRDRSIEILDQHVLERFGGVTDSVTFGTD
jgi:alpha-beta hydrolase superfamily lysophospholipase